MFLALDIDPSHLAAAAVGGLIALVLERALLRARRVRCAACGESLRAHRRPRSVKQVLSGGWTCPGCGAELDRKGRLRG